jgi:hypothetical protein
MALSAARPLGSKSNSTLSPGPDAKMLQHILSEGNLPLRGNSLKQSWQISPLLTVDRNAIIPYDLIHRHNDEGVLPWVATGLRLSAAGRRGSEPAQTSPDLQATCGTTGSVRDRLFAIACAWRRSLQTLSGSRAVSVER